jgi:hypothetical protein
MRAALIIFTSCIFTSSLAAQQPTLPDAPQPTHDIRWTAVERLHPGELVDVRDSSSGDHEQCSLDYADDAALTCQIDFATAPYTRVAYPRQAIDRVWVFRPVHESNQKWIYIAAGIGASLGAIALSGAGPGAIFLGAALGAGVGGSIASMNSYDRIVTKRMLIYTRP